jgi:hypothetical protein
VYTATRQGTTLPEYPTRIGHSRVAGRWTMVYSATRPDLAEWAPVRTTTDGWLNMVAATQHGGTN